MANAVALGLNELNSQYKPKYTGDDSLDKFIERLNAFLCDRHRIDEVKNGEAACLYFEGYEEIPDELDFYGDVIKSEFENKGWHVWIFFPPRQAGIAFKTSPPNRKDPGIWEGL